MAQNEIQFQKGLSLHDFFKNYGTDEQCEKVLAQIRWPKGFKCECCGHDSYCYIQSRKVYQCTRCKYQTSVTRGTVFHSTNLPLSKWFMAIYLISQNKNGISALSLKRQIGVSYPTAWSIKHKLMQVMVETDAQYKLSEIVTIDDAYLGGRLSADKRGRGSSNKQPFIAALQLNLKGNPLYIKMTPIKAFSSYEIQRWAFANLQSVCLVATDGLPCFNAFSKVNSLIHARVVMKKDPETGEIPYFQWLSTIMGNIKSALTGTYRASRRGYAKRYLAEYQYRFNRRFDLVKLFKNFLYKVHYTPPLSGKLLKRAANN